MLNRLIYMEGHNFLGSEMVNGRKKFSITSKGFKLISKIEKVVDKVNVGKSDVVQIRENRILAYLKENPESDKFQVHKALKKYENITPDSVYQALRQMENDDLIEMTKIKNKNYYSLPGTHENTTKPEVKIEATPEYQKIKEKHEEVKEMMGSVKVHEVNSEDEPIITADPVEGNMSIGQILDLVWSPSIGVDCRKASHLKNQDKESVVAKFTDQKTLLSIFDQLPKPLKDKTKIVLDSQHKKVELNIPILA